MNTTVKEGGWKTIEWMERLGGRALVAKIRKGKTKYETRYDEQGNLWVNYYEIKDTEVAEERDEKMAERSAEPVGEEAESFENDYNASGFEVHGRIILQYDHHHVCDLL